MIATTSKLVKFSFPDVFDRLSFACCYRASIWPQLSFPPNSLQHSRILISSSMSNLNQLCLVLFQALNLAWSRTTQTEHVWRSYFVSRAPTARVTSQVCQNTWREWKKSKTSSTLWPEAPERRYDFDLWREGWHPFVTDLFRWSQPGRDAYQDPARCTNSIECWYGSATFPVLTLLWADFHLMIW